MKEERSQAASTPVRQEKRSQAASTHVRQERKQQILSIDARIDQLRLDYQNNPNDIYKALEFARILLQRNIDIRDGGSVQKEAISTFKTVLELIKEKQAKEENSSETTTTTKKMHRYFNNINDEILLDVKDKSLQALLLHTYASLSKQYFMANMFEKAIDLLNEALVIEPLYIDALLSRADSAIILGKYDLAAQDAVTVLQEEERHGHFFFLERTISLLTTVIGVKGTNVISGNKSGWNVLTSLLEKILPEREEAFQTLVSSSPSEASSAEVFALANRLREMHLSYFAYYDKQANDTTQAWYHLSKAQGYKQMVLSLLNQKYNAELETNQLQKIQQIFNENFWSPNVGSNYETPIFIIGFPRSGSTLLERLLDSHHSIVGTGEDSVFNGMLDDIRNAVVEASLQGSIEVLQKVVKAKAKSVLETTLMRWINILKMDDDVDTSEKLQKPKRFVDKMLTNFMNVGFIHLLFPKALILHVYRNPMDTLFSAYKNNFAPGGGLDHTCNFQTLAHKYAIYREVINHWDDVLPGRIVHVKYEDIVHDTSYTAKSIIEKTGLEWNDEILKFHEKKHAVNTLSTTQVRKGIYKDSLKSWKKYEKQLQPLVDLIGDLVEF